MWGLSIESLRPSKKPTRRYKIPRGLKGWWQATVGAIVVWRVGKIRGSPQWPITCNHLPWWMGDKSSSAAAAVAAGSLARGAVWVTCVSLDGAGEFVSLIRLARAPPWRGPDGSRPRAPRSQFNHTYRVAVIRCCQGPHPTDAIVCAARPTDAAKHMDRHWGDFTPSLITTLFSLNHTFKVQIPFKYLQSCLSYRPLTRATT